MADTKKFIKTQCSKCDKEFGRRPNESITCPECRAKMKEAAKNPTPVTVPPPPLKVEVAFPSIFQVKQAIQMDKDGHLILAIQFQARVDPNELFRFINLLNQQHGAMYALIGSEQAAFDFRFDKEKKTVEFIEAAKQITGPKAKKPDKIEPPVQVENKEGPIDLHSVTYNHIPEDSRPFGVHIEYVRNGTGEIKSAAGRGMSPSEAILSGVKSIGLVPETAETFEVIAALEELEPTPECSSLLSRLEANSFDVEPKGE